MARRDQFRRDAHAEFKRLRGRSLLEEDTFPSWLKVVVPGGVDETVSRMHMVYRKYLLYVSRSEFWRDQFQRQLKLYEPSKFPFVDDLNPYVGDQLLLYGSQFCDQHPLDTFLADHAHHFSTAGKKQLLRWKLSRYGAFECGPRLESTFLFRPWDLLTNEPSGDWFHVHLNYEGKVNPLGFVGQILLGNLCPWAPEYGVSAIVGMPANFPKSKSSILTSLLALRDVEFARRPWPWNSSDAVRRTSRLEWASREWQGWLNSRLGQPFDALTRTRVTSVQRIRVLQLLPILDESDTLKLGAHAVCEVNGNEFPWPLEQIYPLDPFSREAETIAEYRDFANRGIERFNSSTKSKPIVIQPEVERRWRAWRGLDENPATESAESA